MNDDFVKAIALLKESRETIAACFRVMSRSSDPDEIIRLGLELDRIGIKDGIGVRIQGFIKAHE